ncbi:MAG TPA: hypothetical protein VEG62_09120, partial [Acidimicrobiales bacterium]|nr:hypothetical protein [Acidimicrobiales bacterium]
AAELPTHTAEARATLDDDLAQQAGTETDVVVRLLPATLYAHASATLADHGSATLFEHGGPLTNGLAIVSPG